MTISAAAKRSTDEVGRRNDHLLAPGYEDENLFPSLRGTDGARKFFEERRIKWWRASETGDDTSENGPTRNLVSSQVACVNFLLPLAGNSQALCAVLRTIDPAVQSIVPLSYSVKGTDKSVEGDIELEWVGIHSTLEGGRYLRGSHATSADGLLVADLVGGGRCAFLFEWKYKEDYADGDNKGLGEAEHDGHDEHAAHRCAESRRRTTRWDVWMSRLLRREGAMKKTRQVRPLSQAQLKRNAEWEAYRARLAAQKVLDAAEKRHQYWLDYGNLYGEPCPEEEGGV